MAKNILRFEELRHAVQRIASFELSLEQQTLILLKSFFISIYELGFVLPRSTTREECFQYLLPQNPIEYTELPQRLRKMRSSCARGDSGSPRYHNMLKRMAEI